MRIGIISTLSRPVPPIAEGSVELLVHYITEHLVSKGHEVTLFALPNSRTSAKLISPVDQTYVNNPDIWDWQLYEAFQVREAYRRWQDFDIINCHSYHFGMLFADMVPIPSLQSMHLEPGPDNLFLARNTENRYLHFCSEYQARDFKHLAGNYVIPHGINTDNYDVSSQSDTTNYVAWIGRFHPDKAPLKAIEIARAANCPIRLAGPLNEYFQDTIQPLLVPGQVDYIGEVSGPDKSRFLSAARALLYPVERGEPFGLVLIEAMACGLPTIALNRGAVCEIVEQEVTGFICKNEQEMIDSISRVDKLDRGWIRSVANTNFSRTVMGDRIENAMAEIIETSSAILERRP